MPENKTKPTSDSAVAFLNKIRDRRRRDDCLALMEMMRQVSGAEPVMWGSAIVGFGTYHYVYESGREGDTVVIGFSPRKQNISIYLMGGLQPVAAELAQLGKHKTGKGCLYINSLSDVNAKVLEKILAKAYKTTTRSASAGGSTKRRS